MKRDIKDHPLLKTMTAEQLLQMLVDVREVAWVEGQDGRTKEDFYNALTQICRITRDVDNYHF